MEAILTFNCRVQSLVQWCDRYLGMLLKKFDVFGKLLMHPQTVEASANLSCSLAHFLFSTRLCNFGRDIVRVVLSMKDEDGSERRGDWRRRKQRQHVVARAQARCQ